MTKWIICSACVALLAGCSQKAATGTDPEVNAYLQQVNSALIQNFGNSTKYAGKTCKVTAQRRPDGRYNVLRTEGDEALCLKSWQTVSSMRNLPLPPKNAPEGLEIIFPQTDAN
ncbi:cell envelope integrity TolA C-terminal domain-containing protein [Pantoea sp. T14]|uniref:cell envelope integrity TolA C-terminal domain-containing protein n=1 Tax=Pantoea sp. T14 TaxID=3085685 RepID=UPI002FCC67BF